MILITGATGLVGCHLLFKLLKDNHKVRALHRKGSDLKRVRRVFSYYSDQPDSLFDRIDWFEADLLHISELREALRGVSRVYHCAALISFDPGDKDRLYETNVTGTFNLVNLCIKQGVEKICFTSSIAALGDAQDVAVIDETVSWDEDTQSNYAITKHQAEMEIWRGIEEGVPAVIVNPGIIIGPGFWHTGSGTLFKMVAKRQKWYPPGGTGFVTINDVIGAMVRAMDSDISGERYVLVNQNLAYKDIFFRIAREFNLPPPRHELKLWQLKLLMPLDWLRAKLRGKTRRITRDNLRGVTRKKIYNGEKICQDYTFTYEPLSEAIYFACLRYQDEYPHLFRS